jgi:hypothetical protein
MLSNLLVQLDRAVRPNPKVAVQVSICDAIFGVALTCHILYQTCRNTARHRLEAQSLLRQYYGRT